MSLLSLPDELVAEISSYFVPGLDIPLGSKKITFQGGAFLNGRLTLYSLANTNRRLNGISTPYLYRTICICDLPTLFDLVGTFVRTPRLVAHVRALAVVTSLLDPLDEATESKAKHLFDNVAVGSTLHGHLQRCYGESEVASHQEDWINLADFEEFVESTCALLLCLASKLQTLYLYCPAWPATPYESLAGVFETCRHDGLLDFLPHLSRLCIVADPTALHQLLPPGTPQVYMSAGTIKHLELFGASTPREEAVVFSAETWRHVETIHWHAVDALITGSWWYQFCHDARPKLKDVRVSLLPSLYYDNDNAASNKGPGLDEALQFCTDTLKRLDLTVPNMDYYRSHLGRERRLSCLRSMKVLKDLSISATLLFRSESSMGRENICDSLPPSLERLDLIEGDVKEWRSWSDAPFNKDGSRDGFVVQDREYDGLLKRAMRQLAFHSTEKLPRLKTVYVEMPGDDWEPGEEMELEAIANISRGNGTTVSFSPRKYDPGLYEREMAACWEEALEMDARYGNYDTGDDTEWG